jgi:Tol biopolymer transport system component
MEFVPGEDLAQRLSRGAVSLDEAVEIAGQVAEALEAAHERGVIHRDLKPANVRVGADGMVKVLDFGLAKSLGESSSEKLDPNLSPTITSDRTRDGVILGTAAYMSPEQARGRPVDRRSDVWAFGCLLFECLTGRKAFPGETISDTLAAILKSEPDWKALPEATPEPLRRLLRRCLAKDARQRLSSLADARLEIDEATAEAPSVPVPSRSAPRRSVWLAAAIVAGLALVALAILFSGRGGGDSEDAVSYRQLTHQRGLITAARIAPDGQTLVYSAAWEGRPVQMFLRRVDGTDALPVALEPERARLLAISSRGELAIVLDSTRPDRGRAGGLGLGTLARIPLTGGTPRAVAENVFDADWDPSGEELAVITESSRGAQLEYPLGEVVYRAPVGDINCVRVSPSGDLLAIFVHPLANNNRGRVAVVSRRGQFRTLTEELEGLTGLAWSPDGSEIWFSGSDEAGHALFAVSLSGELRMLRRSPGNLRLHDVTSDRSVLLAHVLFHVGIAVRPSGEQPERELSWTGTSFVTDISADGSQILFLEQKTMDYEVWLRGTDGSAPTRLGPGLSFSLSPGIDWALASLPSLEAPLTLLPTGPGTPREFENSTGVLYATWTPDGKSLVSAVADREGQARLYIQDIQGGEARAISEEPVQAGVDRRFYVSPDGRWVAALSPELMPRLLPLEGDEPRDVLGARTGDAPCGWSEDGRSLFVAQTRRRVSDQPGRVDAIDLASGERRPVLELMPRDPAGIGGVFAPVLTPDAQGYAYSYMRRLDTLFLLTGVE